MDTKVLKIAIVIHGRFDGFELARELIGQGHDVTLFTNYPKWAVKRFGILPRNVISFWQHGVISRIMWFLQERVKIPYPETWLHKMFGRWAAKQLSKKSWDVVHCWSGISEEILQSMKTAKTLKILMRSSAGISTQERLLKEEIERTGINFKLPSRWMIEREKREYAMTDYIRVISQFAYKSFIEEGIDMEKVVLISAAAPVESFRPSPKLAEERYGRIMRGEPLRILYVGVFSFQKGMWDMAVIARNLKPGRFKLRIIGPMDTDAKNFAKSMRSFVEFIPKKPQHELPKWYEWADVFVFPTIQDGHAQVLAQAQASGLPVLTTTNCQGPDVIVEGKTGWVLPIREPGAFINKLLWCDSHRNELAKMAKDVYENYKPRNWRDAAKNFAEVCLNLAEKV